MPANCPFCNPDAARILLESESGIALYDAFPVSNGHAIVVPRKHVGSVFDLTAEEQSALWRLAAEVRARLRSEFRPEGFNIAVNDGRAAGQTIAHAHIHVIPRYAGDVADPRGGIRWVIAEKAKYW